MKVSKIRVNDSQHEIIILKQLSHTNWKQLECISEIKSWQQEKPSGG